MKLLVAGAFLLGVACFIAGLVIEFAASLGVGSTLLFVGGLLMLTSRLMARRMRLPAP